MQILNQLSKKKLISKRAEQVELAQSILDTFEQKRIGIFESPTGTGKTLAFMTAAVEFCLKNPANKVIISTSSKQLQSQMVQEIEKISKVKDLSNFKYVIVKGKSNYLLRKKIEENLRRCLNKKNCEIYKKLLEEADNVGGDIELLSDEIIEQVNAITPEMLDSLRTPVRLSMSETDYALRVREQAEQANLIIVNHSLFLCYNLLLQKETNPFFKTFAYDSETLPEDKSVSIIIDEAHTLENVAQRLFAKETAVREILFVAEHLIKSVSSVKANARFIMEYGKTKEYIENIADKAKKEKVEYIHITKDKINFDPVVRLINTYIESFKSFGKRIISLIPKNDDFINIKEKATRINEVINVIYSILRENKPVKSHCYLITFSPEKKYPSFSIVTPRIGGAMHSVLVNFDSIVMLSGTLRDPDKDNVTNDSDKFKIIRTRLAIDSLIAKRKEGSIINAKVFQGFNLKKLATVYVYPDGPYPPKYNDENKNADYRELLKNEYLLPQKERILSILRNSKKALILTTAHYETELYKQMLLNILDKPIITYPDNGSSLIQKIEEFKNSDSAVLITASAWEGLDTVIDTLIISKLPFASPNDPYYIAYHENERNYFQGYYSEKEAQIKANLREHLKREFDTFIKFRQGLGRAIRGSNDYCDIYILDPRAYEPRYYQKFLLNTYNVVEIRKKKEKIANQ